MAQAGVGQGLARGVNTARLAEQQGAQSALSQALGTRDQLNQGAYLKLLSQQLGISEAELQALLANQKLDLQAKKDKDARDAAGWNAAGAVGGTIVGAYFGGPGGAAAGSSAGSHLGDLGGNY